jgi:hypothetical protein
MTDFSEEELDKVEAQALKRCDAWEREHKLDLNEELDRFQENLKIPDDVFHKALSFALLTRIALDHDQLQDASLAATLVRRRFADDELKDLWDHFYPNEAPYRAALRQSS